MTNRLSALSLVVLLGSGAASGADERALRSAFEGREVELLIDLPATTKGLDLYPSQRAQYDMGQHQARLMSDGIGVRQGSLATVTLIKVKGKHIEFQLGAGGQSQKPKKPSTYVPKSNFEKDLEDQLDDATTDEEKRRLRRMLEDARNRRKRQEKLQEALAEQEYRLLLGDRTEEDWDAMAGSRINVRYERGVPADVLTPAGLRRALDGYVNFEPRPRMEPAEADAASMALPVGASYSGTLPIHKGQRQTDVDALFGGPEQCAEQDQGVLKVSTCTYQLGEASLEASFVDGVMVRYVLTSN
jgi:hypothetical protein